MIRSRDVLIQKIEAHMRATKMSPARLGREAVGDPKFVFQLWEGREPRQRTVDRVVSYLERQPRGHRP